MTETGDPLENPVAERVNGIIKNEYLQYYDIDNLEQAKDLLSDIIDRYNRLRPHQSLNMITPEQAHNYPGVVPKTWSRNRQSLTL